MKIFVLFFLFWCLHSCCLVSTLAQPRSDGIYIVYTGAAISSTVGFDESNHILSSSSMKSWEDRVIHRYSSGFSGFAARLSEEEAEYIAQRPEVVSVFADPVLQLHTTRSWDFLKELSTGVGSNSKPPIPSSSLSGQDVIIGILDTGIWPEAKSFNDDGMNPIPKRWKGKCILGTDFKVSNCNKKLIGARNYVVSDNSSSARDYNGHGTHVAGIVAGRAVPDASYNGLARGTAQGGSLGSRIAVYRVCNDRGCDGSAILKAFDDAIADGVDIISLSFGSFGDTDISKNPIAIGAFHASVEKGILVVASAGDTDTSDHDYHIVMNAAPWILTVGATTIDRLFESNVVLGGNIVIKGGGVHSANFQKTPIYPLIDGASAKNSDSREDKARDCYPDTLDGEKVRGKIVLCDTQYQELGIGGRYEVVTRLGGIGLIYKDPYGSLVGSAYGSFPVVPVSWQDRDVILSYIATTRNPVATILPTTEAVSSGYKPAPSVAYFSKSGSVFIPAYHLLKPDIAAPGVEILSAWPSNDTDEAFNILSGTSMSCPHVSGIAAILKSRYPSWTPSAIKSAIMTTAIQTDNLNKTISNNAGWTATPYDYGAGEVTLLDPSQPGLIYETEMTDYLTYLCNTGLDVTKIKLIISSSSNLPTNFSCSKNSVREMASDMNYPSIAIGNFSHTLTRSVIRTVTNVGEEAESTYVASVEMSYGFFKVHINPKRLQFTKQKRKLSYRVTIARFSNMTEFVADYRTITWRNEKYRVCIPLVVS